MLPWSYSSLQSYETCPWRHFLTRIDRQVEEPQTDATRDGNEKHKALELAVKGTKPLPEKYAKYDPLVQRVRAAEGQKFVEYNFGLTSALQPTDYWGGNVWARGKIDVGILRDDSAILLDWKAGKRKMDVDQLRLFALAGFSLWPKISTVTTGYVWLLPGSMDKEVFAREQAVEIHQDFAARVHRMETSEKTGSWPKRPSGLCREWCPVGRSLCEHCGK